MDENTIIVAIVLIVLAITFAVTTGVGAAMVTVWRIVAAIMVACVHVPWGIALSAIGIAIAWHWPNVIGCLIGGALLYLGGNYLFGAIEGLIKNSEHKH